MMIRVRWVPSWTGCGWPSAADPAVWHGGLMFEIESTEPDCPSCSTRCVTGLTGITWCRTCQLAVLPPPAVRGTVSLNRR